MSVRASAGRVRFILRNTGRESANPPVVFPSLSGNFSWGIWVKVTTRIPTLLVVFAGVDGSELNVGHDGERWHTSSRAGNVGLPTQYFLPVVLNRWTYIALVKLNTTVYMGHGIQDESVDPWTHPVILDQGISFETPLTADFDSFHVFTENSSSISAFKFWNSALSLATLQSEGQSFAAGTAMWASTLRTPGDLSNIANPYADRNWDHGHAYSEILPTDNLIYDNDPAYMANNTPCPTWVYPTEFTNVFIDPGLTPLVSTVYKAPQLYEFADKGSVTPNDAQIQSIIYYGSAFGGVDPGTPFTECWGLYHDENGVEIATMGDPAYRFVPGDTAVTIPGPIKASTMYAWKFGGQFVWNPVTPQGETKTAHLAYMLLLVTFIGYPTGIPQLPVDDLAGLFAIRRDGQPVDRYNRGVELKIPDPTIRTAYIGE